MRMVERKIKTLCKEIDSLGFGGQLTSLRVQMSTYKAGPGPHQDKNSKFPHL